MEELVDFYDPVFWLKDRKIIAVMILATVVLIIPVGIWLAGCWLLEKAKMAWQERLGEEKTSGTELFAFLLLGVFVLLGWIWETAKKVFLAHLFVVRKIGKMIAG